MVKPVPHTDNFALTVREARFCQQGHPYVEPSSPDERLRLIQLNRQVTRFLRNLAVVSLANGDARREIPFALHVGNRYARVAEMSTQACIENLLAEDPADHRPPEPDEPTDLEVATDAVTALRKISVRD